MQDTSPEKLYGPLLLREKWIISLVLLLSVVDAWVAVRLPYLMSIAVDDIIGRGQQDLLPQMIYHMLALAVCGSVAGLMIMICSAVLTQNFGDGLRGNLFRRIMDWSWEQNSQASSGAILTRIISDTQVLSQFVIAVLQTLIRPALVIVFSLISIWRLGKRYLIVLAFAAPVEGVLLWLMMSRIKPRFRAMQMVLEKTNSYVQKMLSALRFIRVNLRIEDEEKKFDGMNRELYDSSLAVQQIIAVMNPLLIFILNLAITGTLWISGRVAGSAGESMGSILAAILYLQQLLMSLLTIGQLFQSWSRFQISKARLDEVWKILPKAGERIPAPEGNLKLHCSGASYCYPRAASEAISDISLEIPQGSFVAIVGPTGAGKSTLCRLLGGMLCPTAGEVTAGGRSVYHMEREGQVQFVPQTASIFSDTVMENIFFGLSDVSREEVERAARVAQADEFIRTLPQGYDTLLAQGGSSLSGGQRQCIVLARALLRRPKVLILDDSCSAMDFRTEKTFLRELRSEYPGMSVVLVSNRIPSVQEADWIQVIEDGKCTDCGNHKSLYERNAFYRTASQIQMGEVSEWNRG